MLEQSSASWLDRKGLEPGSSRVLAADAAESPRQSLWIHADLDLYDPGRPPLVRGAERVITKMCPASPWERDYLNLYRRLFSASLRGGARRAEGLGFSYD